MSEPEANDPAGAWKFEEREQDPNAPLEPDDWANTPPRPPSKKSPPSSWNTRFPLRTRDQTSTVPSTLLTNDERTALTSRKKVLGTTSGTMGSFGLPKGGFKFTNEPIQCSACDAPAPTQVCIGCGAGFYCNVGCQRQHWPEHKSSCGGGSK
jgi:hypothetical protein